VIERDPRFLRAVELFNEREYLVASDLFEELFFEAIRDELDFIRIFLQISTGLHHIERGQRMSAIERLRVGTDTIVKVSSHRGFDLGLLSTEVEAIMETLREHLDRPLPAVAWPIIRKRTG
jgi:hypothetical protein